MAQGRSAKASSGANTNPTMLAHAASAQGEAAVAHILGHPSTYNSAVIPNCIYTNPEVAAAGLTEDQLRSSGIDYKTGIFSLAGNGKSMIEGSTSGLVKFLVAKEDSRILGVHMMGPRVTDMIGEIAVAMNLNATISDITSTIHAHPTVSEAIVEAALDVTHEAIHWPPRT